MTAGSRPSVMRLLDETGLGPRERRRLGGILTAYGLVGLALILLTLIVVAGSLGAVIDVGTTIQGQRDALVRSLDAADAAFLDLDRATGDAGANVVTGAAAARDAAQLTTDLAGTMEGLATASSVSVLGSHPFADLGDRFATVAARSRTLSTSLESLAATMDRDVTDIATVRASMSALRTEVSGLREMLAGPAVDGQLGALGTARLILVGLLLWLAVPAAVSLVAGWFLLRPSQPPPSVR